MIAGKVALTFLRDGLALYSGNIKMDSAQPPSGELSNSSNTLVVSGGGQSRQPQESG
jgi:hypothetical protein